LEPNAKVCHHALMAVLVRWMEGETEWVGIYERAAFCVNATR